MAGSHRAAGIAAGERGEPASVPSADGRTGALPRDWLSSPWTLCLVAVAAALIRGPRIVIEGRLWAEEGTNFAQDLIGHGFWYALTYIYKGNFAVLTSVPVWIALQLPVRLVPFVVTWLAMAAQFVLACQFSALFRVRGIAPPTTILCFLGFLLLPVQYEIAASATNLQWICSLSMVLILLMPGRPLAARDLAIVPWGLLSGLTGVCSSMLAPAFLYVGIVRRSASHLVLGGVLSLTALIQIASLLTHPSVRHLTSSPYVILTAIGTHTVVTVMFGIRVAAKLGWMALADGRYAHVVGGLIVVFSLAVTWLLYRMARRNAPEGQTLIVLLLTWLGVSVLNVMGSLGDYHDLGSSAFRYFAVGALCFMILVALALRGRRVLSVLAFAWIVAVALIPRETSSRFASSYEGPSWAKQVDACRRSVRRSICRVEIWPDARRPDGSQIWTVDLPAGS